MRLYLSSSQWDDQPIRLAADEARYVTQVLRATAGDRVDLFDGCGRIGAGKIHTAAAGEVEVELLESTDVPRPVPEVWLGQALPKGRKVDLVIEKCTELGLSRLTPLQTRHAVTQLDGNRADKKVARWQEIARGATRQCGRAWAPVIDPVQPLAALLADESPRTLLLCSLAAGARPLREVLAEVDPVSGGPVVFLVGPEGDFSDEETEACLAAGAIPVDLGPSVLRTETAGIYAAGAVRYQFG